MERQAEAPAAKVDAPARVTPSVEVQHVWYEIRRGPAWRSMALVAVDDGPPPAMLARAFGGLATEEKTRRILVVNASTQRSHAAAAKAPEKETLWQELARGDRATVSPIDERVDYLQLSRFDRTRAARVLAGAPHGVAELTAGAPAYDGAIFAIDSLLHHPGATPLVRAVDVVVLCIRLGATSLDHARRLTEIIGAGKIVGSIALRPGARSA